MTVGIWHEAAHDPALLHGKKWALKLGQLFLPYLNCKNPLYKYNKRPILSRIIDKSYRLQPFYTKLFPYKSMPSFQIEQNQPNHIRKSQLMRKLMAIIAAYGVI